jgi:hypothetical protein
MLSGVRGLAVLWLTVTVAGCVVAPPVQEMSDARQAIVAAEKAEADRFAPDAISAARRLIGEAEQDIASHSYGPARLKALRAQDRAVRALRQSQDAGVAE